MQELKSFGVPKELKEYFNEVGINNKRRQKRPLANTKFK